MAIQAIVLDIEGTVCPISFVKEKLFPYALNKVRELVPKLKFPLDNAQNDEDNQASDADLVFHLKSFPEECLQSSEKLIGHVEDLTNRDVKASYWKSLQGYLWKSGYINGEIEAPVYKDAIDNIPVWDEQKGLKVYIYSSGSVNAQKLLFGHCENGIDLTKHITGYFDTINAGPKLQSSSYQSISEQIDIEPANVLFLSDNHHEIDAAKAAGWNVQLVYRPGNSAVPEGYSSITSTNDYSI